MLLNLLPIPPTYIWTCTVYVFFYLVFILALISFRISSFTFLWPTETITPFQHQCSNYICFMFLISNNISFFSYSLCLFQSIFLSPSFMCSLIFSLSLSFSFYYTHTLSFTFSFFFLSFSFSPWHSFNFPSMCSVLTQVFLDGLDRLELTREQFYIQAKWQCVNSTTSICEGNLGRKLTDWSFVFFDRKWVEINLAETWWLSA
jgi:hypothetical protein